MYETIRLYRQIESQVVVPVPSFPPLLDSALPTIFADFARGQYWYSGSSYSSLASWLSAMGASFSRSSSGSFTNSSGLLVPNGAANDVLRFDYDPATRAARGMLFEGDSTNRVIQSNDPTVSWGGSNMTRALNVTGPDGLPSSAWTLTGDSSPATAHEVFQPIDSTPGSITAGTTYTYSQYLKAGSVNYGWLNVQSQGSGTYLTVVFDLSNGTVGENFSANSTLINANIKAAGNGWYRCSITFTLVNDGTYVVAGYADAASGNSILAGFGDVLASANNSVLWYQAQFEALAHASSIIPTTTASASRSKDVLTANPFPSFNASGVSYFAKGRINGNSAGTGYFISSGGGNPEMNWSGNGPWSVQCGLEGVFVAATASGTQINFGDDFKVATAQAVADYAAVQNGQSVGTNSTAGAWAGSPILTLCDDQGQQNNRNLWGTLSQFGYWNFRASNSGIQRITAP